MNLKRVVLAIMTVVSLLSVVFALTQSLGEPQVQAQLELYQTNLILNSAELANNDTSSESDNNLSSLSTSLAGANPYETAEKQYQKTLDLVENSLTDLKTQSSEEIEVVGNTPQTPRKLLKQNIRQNQNVSNDLKIKLGIIDAYQNKLDSAQVVWRDVSDNNNLTSILNNIWINNQVTSLNTEANY